MRKVTLAVLLLAACDSSSTPGAVDGVDGTDTLNLGDSAAGDTGGTGTAPADTTTPQDTTPADTNPPQDTTPTDTNPPEDTTPTDTNPPQDTTPTDTNPGDTNPPEEGSVGAACTGDGDCGPGGVCLELPGGYCSLSGCDTAPCPGGSECFQFTDGTSYCIQTCADASECRGAEGYTCDADSTCWPGTTPTGDSPVGGPCEADEDCKDAGAFCYPATFEGQATGFFQGYCMIPDCTDNSCPSGSTCQAIFEGGGTACVDSCGTAGDGCNQGYACYEAGICFPSCAESGCPSNYACDGATDTCTPSCTADSCPDGTVCKNDGTCGEPPCTATSCGAGYLCAQTGECVPDLEGGPGAGPGPACPGLPARDCTDTASKCGEIIAFEPDEGPGYWDYPINGETVNDEYRSYCRRDLQMLIKWATAVVDCKAAAWTGGNGEPLGLGDMSEANGSIPGTREGEPGHPEGTHEDGYDMDIAYYQTAAAPDNKLRPICPHTEGGQEAYHCTGEPNTLDLWRNTLFLGLLLQSPRTRVIGVDGKVGPLVEEAMDVLCGEGWLEGTPCTANRALAYETTDQGMGWYYFHLHHLHISLDHLASGAPSLPGQRECLTPGCGSAGDGRFDKPLLLPLTRLPKYWLP